MADKTAKHYIDRALQKLLVKQAGVDLTTLEYLDGVDQLNDIMEEEDGINNKLGFTVLTDVNDPVTIPDWATGYIIARLAVDLASEYGAKLPVSLVAEVERRENSIRRRTVEDFDVHFPETLPRGTTFFDDEHFYENPRINDVDTDTDDWIDEDGTPVEEDAIDV